MKHKKQVELKPDELLSTEHLNPYGIKGWKLTKIVFDRHRKSYTLHFSLYKKGHKLRYDCFYTPHIPTEPEYFQTHVLQGRMYAATDFMRRKVGYASFYYEVMKN